MKKMLKIPFALSLLGIIILLFLSQNLEPPEVKISEITEGNLNQRVKIAGGIASVKDFDDKNFQILTIKDSEKSITAIANSKTGLEINKSAQYIIIGKVQEYNSTLQINSDVIFMCDGD